MNSLAKLTGVAAAALFAAPMAQAAAPVAVVLTPGYTFEEYSGTATVGVGAVDTDNALFYIDEQAALGAKSWLIFADPEGRARVTATLQFDQPILAVYTTRDGIESTTPIYGSPSVTYGSRLLTGLEGGDQVAWTAGGTLLTISWFSADPGDHIRVLTAVPEPAPFMLLAGGLVALGWLKRRRLRAD